MILARYQITYANGITQERNLIEHSDLTDVIQPTYMEISRIEGENPRKLADKLVTPLKAKLKEDFGEIWFTNKSPLFNAIETGIMSLLPQQGGDHKVTIQLLWSNPMAFEKIENRLSDLYTIADSMLYSKKDRESLERAIIIYENIIQ